MKTHRWIPHVVTQERIVPAEALTGTQRTDPLAQAGRRILILALVLGSLGADGVALSGYATAAQANAHQSAGTISLAVNTSPNRASTGTGTSSISHPWMY
jgi:hypothetical protein